MNILLGNKVISLSFAWTVAVLFRYVTQLSNRNLKILDKIKSSKFHATLLEVEYKFNVHNIKKNT